jgi:carboxylate-amine ligase
MSARDPSFTIGVEEEYLLVDKATRDLASEPPAELIATTQEALGGEGQVSPEFLRAQIEVGTRVCRTPGEIGAELTRLRRAVVEAADACGLAPIAASTHPLARWTAQQHTDRERYKALAEDFQVVARRLIICGLHVHVGIEDDDLRIDIMNQVAYFLPHLLALSTSSPFWQGAQTGLKSYRLAVFDELPRTGLPPHFGDFSEYRRSLDVLINAGLLADATKIWWDVRPSGRFPTLEMRITDVCPLVEDAVCVAALYLCICRMLYRLRRGNQRWRLYAPFLLHENRWRAQRYGMAQGMVDFGKGAVVPFPDLIEELIELLGEDAAHFGCRREIEHARAIAARGTSADRQLARYRAEIEAGRGEEAALKAVVDDLVAETRPAASGST